MSTLDIILILCFLPCIYFGIKNGLVKQIVSFCVIFFGIKLASRFSYDVSLWISKSVSGNPFLLKLIAFILIFFVIAILLNLLGKLIEKIIKISLLGWLNRLLGILLSFFIFLIVISVIVYLVNSANSVLGFIPKQIIAESKLYQALLDFSKFIFPYLKELF